MLSPQHVSHRVDAALPLWSEQRAVYGAGEREPVRERGHLSAHQARVVCVVWRRYAQVSRRRVRGALLVVRDTEEHLHTG